MSRKENLFILITIWSPIIISIMIVICISFKLFKSNTYYQEQEMFSEYQTLLNYRGLSFEEKHPSTEKLLSNPFIIKRSNNNNLPKIKKQPSIYLHLTSILISKEKKSCLINGKIYQIGDALPKGRIIAIGPKWVKIKLPEKEVLLHVGEKISL